jgi:hypothetical protein
MAYPYMDLNAKYEKLYYDVLLRLIQIRMGNFLLAWAGQFAGIENQTMHRFEQYLKILQL